METQTIEQLDIIIKAKVDDAIKSVETLVKTIKSKLGEATQSINSLNNGTRNFATTTSSSMNTTSVQYDRLKNTIKSTTAQQELLIRKIQDIEGTLNDVDLSKMLSTTETLEMQAELEKLKNKLNQVAKAEENVGDKAQKSSNKSKKAFNGLWKVIKRGVLLTLGVESAFSFLRQGMASAVSVNEELASKQQIVQNAIGQIFVPIMMKAYDVVQYLVAGLGLLIKAFTGIDVFAKLTTKNLNNTNKSAKALNKTLSGIDDIDTLSSSSGSLSGGIGSDLKALNEFQEKLKEVQEKFEKWGVFDKVTKIKEFVSKYIMPCLNWFLDHPTALATFFGIILSGKLLGSITALLGSKKAGTGLLGLVDSLGILGKIGVITIGIQVIYENAEQIYEDLQRNKNEVEYISSEENQEKRTKQKEEGLQSIDEAIESGDLNKNKQDYIGWLQDNSKQLNTNTNAVLGKLEGLGIVFAKIGGTLDDWEEHIIQINSEYAIVNQYARKLLDNADLTEEEYKDIREVLRNQRDVLEEQLEILPEGSKEYERAKDLLEETEDMISEINNEHLKVWENYGKQAKEKIEGVKNGFFALFSTTKEVGIKTSGLIAEKFGINLNSVGEAIKTTFAKRFDDIKKGVDDVEKDVKTRDFSGWFSNLRTSLKGIFDKNYNIKIGASTENLKNTLSTTFTNMIKNIGNIFGGLSNTLSKTSGIKDIASKVSSWTNSTLKNIGFFANGNVATSPTLGVFGEYANAKSNPEITAPQNILRQTFRDELKNNSNNGSFERLTINLGAEAIFDEFIDYVNNKYSNGVQVFKEA